MIQALEILSDAQNKVNDLAMERIQRGEWLDMLNLVAVNIAQETEVYINRYTTIPNQIVLPWSVGVNYLQGDIVQDTIVNGIFWYALLPHTSTNTNAPSVITGYWQQVTTWGANVAYTVGMIVQINNNFYRCNTNHTSSLTFNDTNYLRFWTPILLTSQIYNVELPYTFGREDLAPFKIIRVVRSGANGWIEAMEYSEQAVSRKISGNAAFPINETNIGPGGYSTQFVLQQHANIGSIHLIFGEAFEVGEEVVIDYISNRPWGNPLGTDTNALRIWNPNNGQTIPDFLGEVFRVGLLAKACEKLYFAGDESFANKMQLAEIKYNKELNKAVAYAKNLISNPYNIQIQPLNYLSET